MKTKICVLALLALAAVCSPMPAQETSGGGIVHGPKASFNISAPEGWVLDNESGKGQDLPCVLYPKAESWSKAKTVMYAKVASPQWEGVNAFVAWAIQGMKEKRGTPKEKIASGKTKDGHDYFINEYPATKTYSQWERVGYVQLPQGVAYIVLTSRDQASYQKDSGVLEKVLKTLVYIEPKSEVASGQEFAHRYRQLLDQHAEAQIEPLLTEWREKAPDDPDAWITSANYYFNERQTNISTKPPGPGDIELTDKKGKVTGSISMQQYPNYAEAFNDAAMYHAGIHEWQKARELAEKAHQIDPKPALYLINLGNVSVEMKDFSNARKYFEEALKLEPNGKYAQEAKEALRNLKKK